MRRKPSSIEVYDDKRRLSGWYLAAWRAFRGVSGDVIAEAINSSKGYVSDLENGKKRFNRDHLEAAAAALDVPRGHLLDVNPYKINSEWLELQARVEALPPGDVERATQALNLVLGELRRA